MNLTTGSIFMRSPLLCVLLFIVAGCANQAKFLESKQATALQTAETRAQFEMNCPEAKGTVLSKEVVQPAVMAPRLGAVDRAEYTIGVAGCGKRDTYVVVCPDGGDGCFAAPGRPVSQGK